MNDELNNTGKPTLTKYVESTTGLNFYHQAQNMGRRLLVLKPEWILKGIYYVENWFHFIVDGIDDPLRSTDKEWFNKNFRPIAAPMRICAEAPKNSENLLDKEGVTSPLFKGWVWTTQELHRFLELHLTAEFPPFKIKTILHESPRKIQFSVSSQLSFAQELELENVVEQMGLSLSYEVTIDPHIDLTPNSKHLNHPRPKSDLSISTFRTLRQALPVNLRDVMYDDEEYWRDNYHHLFDGDFSTILSTSKEYAKKTSCLVDSIGNPQNINTYLTLYDTLNIVAPLSENVGKFQSNFHENIRDLIELTKRGYIRWLLPQPLERYDWNWLAPFAEAAPKQFVLSRQLSLLSAANQAQRNPLLFLNAPYHDRRLLLLELTTLKEVVVENDYTQDQKSFLLKYIKSLKEAISNHWAYGIQSILKRGVMSDLSAPHVHIANRLFSPDKGRDYWIEFAAAGHKLTLGDIFSSHIMPFDLSGFSDYEHLKALASVYSGVVQTGSQPHVGYHPHETQLLRDMMLFDHDTNPVRFVQDIGSGDIARIRKLFSSLTTSSEEERAELVANWNQEIDYHTNSDKWNATLTLTGISLTAFTSIIMQTPFSLLLFLLQGILSTSQHRHILPPLISQSYDKLESNFRQGSASHQAILISRIRRNVNR